MKQSGARIKTKNRVTERSSLMKTVTKIDAFPQIQRRKRVAAYARVSSGKDAMKHSLSAQVSYYSAYIQRHIEWEFAGIYADEAVTGTKDNRAEFQRMLSDCRTGKIDMIITKSVTRFARDLVTTIKTVRELKDLNIDAYFEKEKIHSLSGEGELLLSLLAIYAQEESRSASENMKWRIRKMFEEGRPNTGNMLGYRLVDGKLYIVPEEAEIVKQIFADYLDGMGFLAIAKKLNALGVPTFHGGAWMSNSVRYILKNERYTGDMILQKTYTKDHRSKKKCTNRGELPVYSIKNSHEPIIAHEMFDKAQNERKRRAGNCDSVKNRSFEYPFTNRIICEKCGRHYRRKHTAPGTKYDKIAWVCGTFNTLGKDACDSQRIPEDILCTKIAEILGLPAFDEAVFKQKIQQIRVPAPGKLLFLFHDGFRIEAEWQNPSRRESWTEEMKQAARERQLKLLAERSEQNE
jgi:DNA invertase Pin-like site-specific DNA recombinase